MAVGLRKRRRIQMVVVGRGAARRGDRRSSATRCATASSSSAPRASSPSHPPRAGERFRLGGLVEEGSVVRDGGAVRFVVTDGGASVPVAFSGLLPDLFREGQGVIATGQLEGGTFAASEVLARHDESYMPKEVADALKEQGIFRYGGGVAERPGELRVRRLSES